MRLLVLTLLWLCVPTVVAAAELRELRVWDGPESTRVVFDLSDAASHKLFSLSNPDRIVIDIAGIDQAGGNVARRAAVKGVVKQVRSGPRDDGSLRIVFDVSEPVKPKSFALAPNEQYGHRLVLDLYGRTPTLEELADVPVAPRIEFVGRPLVIAVDAGHGGEDPGAIGRSGLREKDVALSIARRLARQIDAQPGMKAVLTRDGDYYVGLRERVNKARKVQADLFVSVHCNAHKNRDLEGSAVYVLSNRGASNEHARWLAHKENSADLVGGLDIHDKDNELAAVLMDLSQASTMEASFDLGGRVLQSLGRINNLQKADVQQAGFLVLKAPDIPSVLVETAFISNRKEEKMLADQGNHDRIARSLLDGIQGYFKSYRPQQPVVDERPKLQKVRQDADEAPAPAPLEVSDSQAAVTVALAPAPAEAEASAAP